MILHIFSGDGKYIDGERKFSNITMIEIVYMLTGRQQFQRGNSRNMARKVVNSKLDGETNLFSGSSFYVGGAIFQRGRYQGCDNIMMNIGCRLDYMS